MKPDDRLQRAQEALTTGRITQEEYTSYLRFLAAEAAHDEAGSASTTPPSRPAWPSHDTVIRAAAFVGVLLFVLTLFWAFNGTGSPTGFVIRTSAEEVNQTFTEDTNLTLNVTNTSTLRISGTLEDGSATIWLHTASGRLLVYTGTTERWLWSEWEDYSVNESVNLTIKNETNTSLWLTNKQTRTPFHNGQTIKKTGHYTIQALNPTTKQEINITIHNNTNLSRTPRSRAAQFRQACRDTCTLDPPVEGPLTLEIVVDGALRIDEILTSQEAQNHAPEQTRPLPNLQLALGEERSIDLNEYFRDPDGDTIIYDYMNIPGITMTIDGHWLHLTAVHGPGGESVIYASDAEYLTQSNSFSVNTTNTTQDTEKTPEEPHNTTGENHTTNIGGNATENSTKTPTNTTTNTTTKRTPPPVSPPAQKPKLGDCSNPDPNKRDQSCFQGAEERFFSQSVLIENKGRTPVARFNPLGNLLVTGELIEHSTGQPDKDDFSVGYLDEDFSFIPTAWIDSRTGDLHLKGMLHEEQITLVAPPNSYTFQNRRGINLGYINPRTGDLYLRGNLIEHRRRIQ